MAAIAERQAKLEITGRIGDASKLTVAEYLRSWIDVAEASSVSPKTAERYRQLIERQVIPHLGALNLQKLRPSHIAKWHRDLLTKGRHDGGRLAGPNSRARAPGPA